jgi:60 kDa SS-A/Ro ribonucleoprotein
MLRTIVQIMRSGQAGRTSLGSRPKRLVREWLDTASIRQLLEAATGTAPSLADIVRMVHPAPTSAGRRAFYGWLIGKPYDVAALPPEIAGFEAWKADRFQPLPDVPFEWLTAFPLSAEEWAVLAGRMGWQALRMNLNTLARHGAFQVEGVTQTVAARLTDAEALAAVRPMPYQLLTALHQVGEGVPLAVQAALEQALERSLDTVPVLPGHLVVCPDVSGSMSSPATGYRRGASTAVRCIDIAALVAAALLRTNPRTRVLPFEQDVVKLTLDPPCRRRGQRREAGGGRRRDQRVGTARPAQPAAGGGRYGGDRVGQRVLGRSCPARRDGDDEGVEPAKSPHPGGPADLHRHPALRLGAGKGRGAAGHHECRWLHRRGV